MPFIGNQPALSYTSFAKQDFTTSATTSYTLDNPVANANELALFINFVRQEPTTAYSASGTSLILTSATSASDDMYCVFLGKAVQTVNPPNSSVGNSQLDVSAINSQTAETSIAGGDEVLIYDTSASALRKMTRTNFVSGVGETNTPNFYAYGASSQTVSDATETTIQFSNEVVDSDSAYDTTNYRFTVPSGKGGLYLLNTTFRFVGGGVSEVNLKFRKNGSQISAFYTYSGAVGTNIYNGINYLSRNLTLFENLSAGDYIDVAVYFNLTGGGTCTLNNNKDVAEFSGFRISS